MEGKFLPIFLEPGTLLRGAGGQDLEVSWVERCKGVSPARLREEPSSTQRSLCGSLLGFTVSPPPRSAWAGRFGGVAYGGPGRHGDVASAERGLPARGAGPGPGRQALSCAPQGLGRFTWCAGFPRRSRLAAGRSGQVRGRLGAAGRSGPPGRRHLPAGPTWQVPGPRVRGSPDTPTPVGYRARRALAIALASLVPRPFAGRPLRRLGEMVTITGSGINSPSFWSTIQRVTFTLGRFCKPPFPLG